MNCREARGLFSARIDGELRPGEVSHLDFHLLRCPECAAGWKSMTLTVRFVRGLPPDPMDTAFVGRVLDRVRGHEIEQRQIRVSLAERLWVSASGFLSVRAWPRRIPVPLGAAFAVGIAAGYLVVQQLDDDALPFGVRPTASVHGAGSFAGRLETTTSRPRVSTPSASASSSASVPAPVRQPFGPALDGDRVMADSTEEQSPVRVLTPEWRDVALEDPLQRVGPAADGRVHIRF